MKAFLLYIPAEAVAIDWRSTSLRVFHFSLNSDKISPNGRIVSDDDLIATPIALNLASMPLNSSGFDSSPTFDIREITVLQSVTFIYLKTTDHIYKYGDWSSS